MGEIKSVLKALRESQSRETINETLVTSDGSYVVVHKKDGKERFRPKEMTADDAVEKFNAIRKHSEGRAWQWLKRLEKAEEPEVEESTETKPEEQVIQEQADETTECPYTNLLNELLNSENKTVIDYEEAIIKFNESTDLPEEKRVAINEILTHIKDEELEHVKEIQKAHCILNGECAEPEPIAEPVEVTVEEPAPVEPEVEVEDDFEVVEESIQEDNEIYKSLFKKIFKDYEEIEKHFQDNGYEVTEVYKEGEGFNVNLRKEDREYFIPFDYCDGYCANLDKAVEIGKKVIEESDLVEGSNAYEYKGYLIIQTKSGYRVKKDGQWQGKEYSTEKDAENYVDSLGEK